MYFRKATTSDLNAIKSLWKVVFSDSERYIDSFIIHFGIERCFVCEINCNIVAMAFALSTQMKLNRLQNISTLQVWYVYACATHSDYRKQGIMEKLLTNIYEKACIEGVAGIFLHAADENLTNYYRKLGFRDFFYRKYLKINRQGCEKKAKGVMKLLTPDAYYHKRLQKLEKYCFVDWNRDFFQFLSETGTQFCAYENEILAFRIENNRFIVDELLSGNLNSQITSDLFEFYECDSIEIHTIGNENCFGQMKWNTTVNEDLENAYFAFTLE